MANNVDPDHTDENGKHFRPKSDWEWKMVQKLIRLLKIANSVDPDQTDENGSSVDPDQPAENGK